MAPTDDISSMRQQKTKLVELVGGAADGRCIRVPNYATIVAVPIGSGKNYQEVVYTQDVTYPQKFNYQDD